MNFFVMMTVGVTLALTGTGLNILSMFMPKNTLGKIWLALNAVSLIILFSAGGIR